MKRTLISTFLITLLTVSCFAAEKSAPPIVRTPTGIEWLERSMGERINDIIASMTLLNQSGVPLTQTPEDYYDAIDKMLRRNPALYESDLTKLLADYVYEKEPVAREVLDRLKRPAGETDRMGSAGSPS